MFHHTSLGALTDPELRFHNHVQSVVQKAGGLAGELLCPTVCCTLDFMVSLFISNIRPIMDFCSSVWNVGYLWDIRLLESVQRRWTRQVTDISHLGYEDRLKALGIFSIYGSLLWANIIKCWKLLLTGRLVVTPSKQWFQEKLSYKNKTEIGHFV